MGKKEVLLKAFSEKLGQWVCAYCNSNSNQPAATFRELKKLGYNFEEIAPNRWGKNIFCNNCKSIRTHYKLINIYPIHNEKQRINIQVSDRKRIINILDGKDAFTGGSISSTPEVDHKIPWTRLEKDIYASGLSNKEILEHFQLLTREHNLLKDRACSSCKITNKRPPFMEIKFWFDGNENYLGNCYGCGWHDGAKWRRELNEFLKNNGK